MISSPFFATNHRIVGCKRDTQHNLVPYHQGRSPWSCLFHPECMTTPRHAKVWFCLITQVSWTTKKYRKSPRFNLSCSYSMPQSRNQAISKMHWTKSISAKNLAQNATASQVSSKCIRSHESLNKPYYKYVPGHDWCWHGWSEPRNAPPSHR